MRAPLQLRDTSELSIASLYMGSRAHGRKLSCIVLVYDGNNFGTCWPSPRPKLSFS